MKVGDLVRFRPGRVVICTEMDGKEVGVITDLSEPTPMFPLQVVTVAFDIHILEGVSTRFLEVISESR